MSKQSVLVFAALVLAVGGVWLGLRLESAGSRSGAVDAAPAEATPSAPTAAGPEAGVAPAAAGSLEQAGAPGARRAAVEAAPEAQAASERAARRAPPAGPTMSIAGRVSTPGGLGLEAVLVSAAPLERQRAPKLWARTDARGAYAFAVPEARDLDYRVQVAGAAGDEGLQRWIRELRKQGELEPAEVLPGATGVDFEIPDVGRLELVVLDAHTGLELSEVRIEWRNPGDEEYRLSGAGWRRAGEGHNLGLGLPAGELELRLRAPGYAAHELAVSIAPQGAQPLVVALEPHALVRLHFVLAANARAVEHFAHQLDPLEWTTASFLPYALLLTEEEHERWLVDPEDFLESGYVELYSGGRLLERAEDGAYHGRPEPGTYVFAAASGRTLFDPPSITVAGEPIEFTVSVDRDLSPLADDDPFPELEAGD